MSMGIATMEAAASLIRPMANAILVRRKNMRLTHSTAAMAREYPRLRSSAIYFRLVYFLNHIFKHITKLSRYTSAVDIAVGPDLLSSSFASWRRRYEPEINRDNIMIMLNQMNIRNIPLTLYIRKVMEWKKMKKTSMVH